MVAAETRARAGKPPDGGAEVAGDAEAGGAVEDDGEHEVLEVGRRGAGAGEARGGQEGGAWKGGRGL